MKTAIKSFSCLGLLISAGLAGAQNVSQQLENPQAADVEITGHVLEPQQISPAPDQLDLQMPEGFELSVFAEGLANPRMLAVAEDGSVYVTQRNVGELTMLRDEDGDGAADQQMTVARRPDLHGVAIEGSRIFLVTIKELYRAHINPDGSLSQLELLADDLPDAGQHPNRTIAVGPDGMLYLSVGSTCNACSEGNPENATILRMAQDGTRRTIFATGLRNTIGFAFEPETGALYGMDHGIDWLGDSAQHEELNHIVQGNRYGWPYVYGDGKINPQDEPPAGTSIQDWLAQSTNPVGLYTAHSAPMQMVFYTGDQFPQAYRGDAFVAMRGSWNRKPPSGYEVARIRFDNGNPAGLEPFITGFLVEESNGWSHRGRLAGLVQTPDGSLLLSDDANGIIYRISYSASESTLAN